jgi:SAM-dependent methyltransferase
MLKYQKESFRQSIKNFLPRSCIDIFHFLKYRLQRPQNFFIYQEVLSGKSGLEIGGPSMVFKIVLPIYQVVANLDGVNFQDETMWEGQIQSGKNFKYFKNKIGKQFINDATNLKDIKSDTYDFLISSNCLEHIANPIRALEEWLRVIKSQGNLLLVLPRKESNFDHQRPITKFEHILNDYHTKMSEHDLTHVDEILKLHDLSRDHASINKDYFKSRCLNNYHNRGLHHHVFDMPLISEIFEYCKIDIITKHASKYDYIVLGRLRK